MVKSTTSGEFDIHSWVCPIPLKNYSTIVMGHGSGGRMMSDLIRHMFLPLFKNETLALLGDSAVLEIQGQGDQRMRLAFSTDSFVVSPLEFPGGDIGELAVNGTVNDLAMSGANPLFLSAGFILEEGLEMDLLGRITTSLARSCLAADVQLVTGDTKVVEQGHGDGLFINTTGIGAVPNGVDIKPQRACPGDVVMVNGTIGDHGMAIMSVREGFTFDTQIVSDTAPLHGLVAKMLSICPDIHCLRDATRGGMAAALNEFAQASNVGISIDDREVPVRPDVQAACEMLGMDPYYVANEGKLIAILPEDAAGKVLEGMRNHPLGQDAAIIGRVTKDHPGIVVSRTGIGGSRVVDLPAGELLPRIC